MEGYKINEVPKKESYPLEELKRIEQFVAKWERKRKMGMTKFIFIRFVLTYGTLYFAMFGILLPWGWLGPAVFLLAEYWYWFVFCMFACTALMYFIGKKIWNDREQRYRLANAMFNRYAAAWEPFGDYTPTVPKGPTRADRRRAREAEQRAKKKKR